MEDGGTDHLQGSPDFVLSDLRGRLVGLGRRLGDLVGMGDVCGVVDRETQGEDDVDDGDAIQGEVPDREQGDQEQDNQHHRQQHEQTDSHTACRQQQHYEYHRH